MNLLPLSLAATAAYWALVTVVVGLGIAAASVTLRTPRRWLVIAAFGLKGMVLSEEKLDELAVGWEMAFAGVPTMHLQELCRLGIAKRCTTAEQFVDVWDMRNEALARELEFRSAREAAAAPKPEYPVPAFILESWGVEAKTA